MSEKINRRNTIQKQVVLEELRKLTSHPTAMELYEITRQRLPAISLGTVYRNLELLSRTGVIRKLDSIGPEARFDGDANEHFHVRCVHCGRVEDAVDVPADFVGREIGRLGDFEILGYRLEFVGVCPECRSESGGNAGPRHQGQAGAGDFAE